MYDALHHPVFEALRVLDAPSSSSCGNINTTPSKDYMHYYRPVCAVPGLASAAPSHDLLRPIKEEQNLGRHLDHLPIL